MDNPALRILLIRPEENNISRIAGRWLSDWEASIGTDTNKQITLLNVATSENLNRLLSEFPLPDIIAFYGHGTRCRLFIMETVQGTGQDCRRDECAFCELSGTRIKDSLIDIDTQMAPFFGRVIYAVACYSSTILGQRLISTAPKGTAYFGYSDELCLAPEILGNEIIQEMGTVVNTGLSILIGDTDGPRFEKVHQNVKNGWFDLHRRIKQRAVNDPLTTMRAVIIKLWGLAFQPKWV